MLMNYDIIRLVTIFNHATSKRIRKNNNKKAGNKLARKIMAIINRHSDYRRVNEYSNGGLWVSYY